MARRVLIRSREENTAVAQIEEMLKLQYKSIYKAHTEQLEECAQQIEADAHYLVPKDKGVLDHSINVYVTRSYRYPGIIASAHALGNYKSGVSGYKGFDYAIAQEENEEYSHDSPEESAHYLAGPFVINLAALYRQITGNQLKVNDELFHAAVYVKNKL